MNPQKFLVVGLGRIGDLVLMTPLFRALKEENPDHQVHLLASHINHEVVKPHPFLDKVYVESFNLVKNIRLIFDLRKEKYDWWIDPKDHKSGTSRYYLSMVNPKQSVGFNDLKFRKFKHSIKPLEEQYGVHISSRFLEGLHPLGLKSENKRPMLEVGETELKGLLDFCSKLNINSYHFVNISSSRPQREWPAEKWIEFLSQIEAVSPAFLICCAPKDRGKAKLIEDHVPKARVYPTKSIKDVSAAISRSNMVLTVDTAVVHISAAFNKPLLGLYMNTPREYKKYFPLSDLANVIYEDGEESEVKEISVNRVVKEFKDLNGMME